jgi:hypothetical protein
MSSKRRFVRLLPWKENLERSKKSMESGGPEWRAVQAERINTLIRKATISAIPPSVMSLVFKISKLGAQQLRSSACR